MRSITINYNQFTIIDQTVEVEMEIDMSKGIDKSKNTVAAVVLLAVISGSLGGCQTAEETSASASSEETTITIEDTTVSEETEETEEDLSTHGELEGQTDYMVLASDYADANGIPRRIIEDTSEIEDPDVRELAEAYLAQGYSIYDQEAELACWQSMGDGEYMFKYGFYATLYTDDSFTDLWVYKMNETLFDYFVKIDVPGVEVEDDGTVIRYIKNYYNGSTVAEFNRETGFGSVMSTSDLTVSSYLNGDLSVIESEAVRTAAEDYASQGFDIYYLEVMSSYGYCFEFADYPYADGISVMSWDEPYYQYDIFEIDEDLFETVIASGELGEETSRDDDGTVINVTTELLPEGSEGYGFGYDLVFDRSTNLITIEFVDDEDYLSAPGSEEYYMPITEDLSVIEDDDLRALAQDYATDDYEIYRFDPQLWYGSDDYQYAGGFSGVYQDGTVQIDLYVFEADEELFEDLLAKQWYGDERSFEDDGTVITGEYISYVIGNNGKHEVVTTIEFDRETGFITISTESPYAP